MSRWLQQFEDHAFQSVWSGLKKALDESSVDDKTILTDVKEMARFRKAVGYIDEILESLDPELTPASTWANFQQQVTPCLQQLNTYNSNKNIAHLQKANEHVDNLLTYVRPYMVIDGKIGKALQKSVKEYSITVDEYLDSYAEKSSSLIGDITEIKNKSEKMYSSIEGVKNSVDEFNNELFGDSEEVNIEDRIRALSLEIKKKYEEINEYYNEILVGDENEESAKKAIANARDKIIEDKDEIKELLESVSKEVNDLEKFYAKVFGKVVDGDDGEERRTGGLSLNLDHLIQSLKDFEKEQKEKYAALNEEIDSLLPGATSAGLATAYKEMKDSFDNPIKNASRVFYWSIGLLVLASILLAIDTMGGETFVTFVKFTDWSVVLKGLVYKIPFYAPVLWLAFYATKRRSEYHRLQQEYAHKEALAKSYNSYKKQIEDLDVKDVDMQKEFIMKAIDAIAYNASETLDGKHGDKMPAQELIEKLVAELAKMQVSSGK